MFEITDTLMHIILFIMLALGLACCLFVNPRHIKRIELSVDLINNDTDGIADLIEDELEDYIRRIVRTKMIIIFVSYIFCYFVFDLGKLDYSELILIIFWLCLDTVAEMQLKTVIPYIKPRKDDDE